jgi:glutamine synthetase
LAYCREKGIRSFDLRFADLSGQWRHVTLPISALTEAAFDEGFGQSIPLEGHPGASRHAILLPQSEANYLDPFTNQPTLILLASVQDAVTREESPYDSRHVAVRAMRFMESTAIGDILSVRCRLPFRLDRPTAEKESKSTTDSFLICGPEDRDFELRCEIAETAIESGLHVERHYRGQAATSEMVLKPSPLIECCDDIMMLRYLTSKSAFKHGYPLSFHHLWASSEWSILRHSESVLVGTAFRGLSDVGLHALGGILKHAEIIAAIAIANCDCNVYPWLRTCSDSVVKSVCRVAVASHHPRARAIEFLGTPAAGNPYLIHAAILMAVLDGIQNKTSPGPALDLNPKLAMENESQWQIASLASDLDRQSLSRSLTDDRDFLIRGEVFSEELLDALQASLTT